MSIRLLDGGVRVTVALAILLLPLTAASSDEAAAVSHDGGHGEHAVHHAPSAHTFTFFVGPANEIVSGNGDESAVDPHDSHAVAHDSHETGNVASFGLAYSYRVASAFGVGLLWERAGFETLHEAFVLAPVSWYVTDQARLLAAPGVKYTGEHSEAMMRVGGGYTFHLGPNFGIGPEVGLDWFEGGRMAVVYGIGFETLF